MMGCRTRSSTHFGASLTSGRPGSGQSDARQDQQDGCGNSSGDVRPRPTGRDHDETGAPVIWKLRIIVTASLLIFGAGRSNTRTSGLVGRA